MSATATAASGHLPVDTLLAWWLHETDGATTEAVDEHLLRCDACGDALDALIALGDGVRAAFGAGFVGAVTTRPFVDRLVALGLRVREYRLPVDGSVECTVAPGDDLLASHLAVPSLEGVERLDALTEVSLEPGVVHRVEDVPFDPRAGEVLYLPPVARVKRLPAHVLVVKLMAVQGGTSREIGCYRFNHSPWPTGR